MKTPNIETKPTHTPTPWTVHKKSVWAGGLYIADFATAEKAEEAIRAVNSHAELVAALTDTLAIARIKWGNLDPDANTVMDNAAKTLASAKGTP